MDEVRGRLSSALDDVCVTVKETADRNEQILSRASGLQRAWEKGGSLRDLVVVEDRPMLVELLRENLDSLAEACSRLRRAQVLALYNEGATTEEIARLFKVTRQRISTVLREARASAASTAT